MTKKNTTQNKNTEAEENTDAKSENKAAPKKTRNRKQNSNETSKKESGTSKGSKGLQQDKQQVNKEMKNMSNKAFEELNHFSEEVDITPYVSNVDGSVYAISGLPEEFIATLFAWVSRSPKSFKEHLKTALKDQDIQGSLDSFKKLDEKAKKFHEKWTVGYGHSSVAEHAVAHVGIEEISRLASAELELANSFLSITEYSQRYQKPERYKWHNPVQDELLAESVECFYNKAFDAFEKLIDGIFTYLLNKEGGDVVDKKRVAELEKLAFEDARYVLPLSMHTQMGMTANGRAWRDALAVLGNSDHAESRILSHSLRDEITKVLPVLLKYATPSQYQKNSKTRVKNLFNGSINKAHSPMEVRLSTVQSESQAIDEILALLKMENESTAYPTALAHVKHGLTDSEKENAIKELLFEMKHFDNPPEVFKHIKYSAQFKVSEANWHQLLRHNRMTDFTFGKATPHFGLTLPPRIVEAGLHHIVKDIAEQSEELYNILVEQELENEAQYVVLNAHRRQIFASFSLWEAYHLINLRTSEEAQWDIRETFESLFKQLFTVHPLLMRNAKRRLS
jgi:thymidylate synthase ThyX